MSNPAFVIGKDRLDREGCLLAADRQRVTDVLLAGGFVLLPSDTAYSVAAVPFAAETRNRINRLLQRPNMPVSLVFASMSSVHRWTMRNRIALRLLEEYCPGPITVVCTASANGIPAQFFDQTVASRNRTIGVRIPDSAVERDMASVTVYPVTTVAVRDVDDGEVGSSFDAALEAVAPHAAATGFPQWCAIEGDVRYGIHSTVVEVTADGSRLTLLREGAIAFSQIWATA